MNKTCFSIRSGIALLWACVACLITPTWAAGPSRTVLYVAVDGNDAWSGRLAKTKSDKSDGPFASLDRARDEIRKLRASQGLPSDGVTVVVRGGTY
jgi:hypothetical protein